jgi:hypothetical protein
MKSRPWVSFFAIALSITLLACGSVAPTSTKSDGGAGTGGSAGGTAGATGAAGVTGSAGMTGAAGVTGAAGITGAAGVTGTAGVTGAAGSTGLAGAGGASGGAGGNAANQCDSACAGGTCWLQLDGARACVAPRATPTLSSCQGGSTTACCTMDADCTAMAKGRCLPLFNVAENFCGGAFPQGNVCRYDKCASDADCVGGKPAGATIATCLPSGALNTYFATCAYGICRTNADCTKHPGGKCTYGQAPTNGVCSLHNELFCAYPTDPCGVGSATPTSCMGGQICVPADDGQGRLCGKGPPQYP